MTNLLGFDLNKAIEAIGNRFGEALGGSPFGSARPGESQAFQGIAPGQGSAFPGAQVGGGTAFAPAQIGGGGAFAPVQVGGQAAFGAVSPGGSGSPFGAVAPGGGGAFGGFTLNGTSPFGAVPITYTPPSSINPFPDDPTAGGAGVTGNSGTASTGLEPNVARWADQTKATFGDIEGLDPDTMLAIMTNESHGDPNIQNRGGYPAYGLFQLWEQPGLNAEQQFAAAKKLAQQKMAGIRDAYAANGRNPDARTRARDFALAWAGHFDYKTGLPDPNSRDVGSGQTAEELSAVFFANYDKIKAGRTATPASPGNVSIANGYAFPVVGYKGQVIEHHGAGERGATDIMAPRGTPIVAMRGGKVIDASVNSLGGNTVTIQGDDGLTYYYAHMDQTPMVQAGQKVTAGMQLGVVGDSGNAKGTGTHLHLGVGYGIQSGAGPQGGAGIGYDLVGALNGLQAGFGAR